jgi:hypothetical protein
MASAACEEKKTDAPPPAKPPASAATTAASSETKTAKEEPEAPKSLTVAQFTTDMPAAACKALTTCKNEEVSTSVGAMVMLMAGFAAMQDPALGKELKGIGDTMKTEKRNAMNGDECTKVMGALTKTIGFTADKVQASVDGKKAEFNGEKAAACTAALATQPNFCKEEKKLTKEPNMGEMDKMMKAYEKDVEAYLQPCKDTLVGKVAEGEACEFDFECAGEKTACKQKKCAKKPN